MLRDFGCNMDDVDLGFGEPLDFEFHPTGIAIGDGKARYLVGAVVMNVVIVAAFALLAHAVSFLLSIGQQGGFEVGRGRAKTPGVVIVPYMFLLPGISLCSARMLFFPDDAGAGAAALGAFGLLFCCVGAYVLWRFCLRRIPTCAVPSADPRLYPALTDEQAYRGVKRAVYAFAFGDRIWISTAEDEYFAEKYGVVFDCFEQKKANFILFEVFVNIALSLSSVWKPSSATECHIRNVFITLIMLVFFIGIAYVRPYFAALENLLAMLIAGTGAVAVVMMTVGIWAGAGPESFFFVLSGVCLMLSAVLLMAKAVWDIIYYILDVCLERRSRAREEAREARGNGKDYGAYAVEHEFEHMPYSGDQSLNALWAVDKDSSRPDDSASAGPFPDGEDPRLLSSPSSPFPMRVMAGSEEQNSDDCVATESPFSAHAEREPSGRGGEDPLVFQEVLSSVNVRRKPSPRFMVGGRRPSANPGDTSFGSQSAFARPPPSPQVAAGGNGSSIMLSPIASAGVGRKAGRSREHLGRQNTGASDQPGSPSSMMHL